MQKSDILTVPAYFTRYLDALPEGNLTELLQQTGSPLFEPEFRLLTDLQDRVYEEGKWTVKQIIRHITDTERIFAYRALRFARNDQTNLPAFDENEYILNTSLSGCSLRELLDEFYALRYANQLMFSLFTEEDLKRSGTANDQKCQVLALGFMIAGHGFHHYNILKNRYFPLLNP